MSDDLVRRFRLLQEALNHGCSDGGCVIEVTKGQHTNGGCKCLYHPEQYKLNRVGHMLRCAQDMADRIEELERILSSSPCEIAAHSNKLTEYMFHWEGRALNAEAKLAKAVGALEEIATDEHPLGWTAIAALAELKGDT